jgi:hypothetical protein
MNPYNGFSSSYRARVAHSLLTDFRSGRLTRPCTCALCDKATGLIDVHLEDYTHPKSFVALCRGCHLKLHNRFIRPVRWNDLISRMDSEKDGRGTFIADAIFSRTPVPYGTNP